MEIVVEEIVPLSCDAVEQERHERGPVLLGERRERLFEFARVLRAVVGGIFIPTSNTRLPAFCAARMIAARLSRVCATGSPRSPSLEPRARMTIRGLCRASVAAMREAPPLEVSPLMLAFATV